MALCRTAVAVMAQISSDFTPARLSRHAWRPVQCVDDRRRRRWTFVVFDLPSRRILETTSHRAASRCVLCRPNPSESVEVQNRSPRRLGKRGWIQL